MSSPLWRRRAHLATEAMIVAAMSAFGVGLASHLVNNALCPVFIAGEETGSVLAELRHTYELEASARASGRRKSSPVSASDTWIERPEAEALFVILDAIWRRSHEGHFVTPDSLDRLVGMVDRSDGRSLRSRRARGFWTIEVISTVGGQEIVIAHGDHPMYAVAAELCRSSLAD